MIFKRFIALLILCIPISNQAIVSVNELTGGQEESVSSLVESCEKKDSSQQLAPTSILVKPSCTMTWNYLRPFSKYFVNLLVGLGFGYGLYRYVPDKFPWIWAGTSTYTSLVLGAAVISYGKENKTLKEEKKELMRENDSLKATNDQLGKLVLSCNSDQKAEVIVGDCRAYYEKALKQQQEKTAAWCKRADDLDVEVRQLRYEKKDHQYFKNSYNYLVRDNKTLNEEMQKLLGSLKYAHQKILSLEENKDALITKICELQNQLNLKNRNQVQIRCARERVNASHQKNLLNSWVTVKA